MAQKNTVALNTITRRNLDTYIELQTHKPPRTTVLEYAVDALIEGRIIDRSEVCSCAEPLYLYRNCKDHCSHCELLIVERKVPK